MLLVSLWNYIRGYVIILAEGFFLERFLNICIHRQIFLWDIKRHKENKMIMKVSINGFKMLRPIARKAKCRIRIFGKKGLPFVINRYKARKTFFAGALIFILIFFALTSFVWSIEINGNKKVASSLIIGRLSDFGIKPGRIKFGIDADNIANNLMLDIKELAWVGVSVKGTKVKIDVAERIKPPDLVPKDTPCNIVAKRDGIVKYIIAKAGYENVKTGDTVIKGQVLISGTVPNKDEKVAPRLVHALGAVYARTWYEKECTLNTVVTEKERTGRIKNLYTPEIFMKKINIFHSKVPFENYDKIEISKRITIGRDFVFPFGVDIEKYFENKLIQRQIGTDEAEKNAENTAYKQLMEEVPENTEIISVNSKLKQKESGEMAVDMVVESIEDIGETSEIGGN